MLGALAALGLPGLAGFSGRDPDPHRALQSRLRVAGDRRAGRDRAGVGVHAAPVPRDHERTGGSRSAGTPRHDVARRVGDRAAGRRLRAARTEPGVSVVASRACVTTAAVTRRTAACRRRSLTSRRRRLRGAAAGVRRRDRSAADPVRRPVLPRRAVRGGAASRSGIALVVADRRGRCCWRRSTRTTSPRSAARSCRAASRSCSARS